MKSYSVLKSLFFSLLLAPSSYGAAIQVQVNQALPHGQDQLGVGSSITLKLPDEKYAHSGVFLGRMVNPDGTDNEYMILDAEKTRVYLANASDVELPKLSTQAVLRQYDQVGGTCTGYGLDHFLQQMRWSGLEGNGSLATTLSTEKGRTQLLVDAINQYYLVTQHKFSITGILAQYGRQFGFKCAKNVFQDSVSAAQYLERKLKTGLPVMISFYVGPNMVTSTYESQDFSAKGTPIFDARLWVPRKKGERESGGHTVVAVSEFEVKGRKKMLMLDSDWDYPRIWDVAEYLNSKTAIAEIEFYSCH